MDRSGGRARHSGDLIAALSGRSPARNLHSDVLWALGLAIVSGTYAEGAILPSDSELLERFGVSRTVLREALKTLAAKGLIEARARIGTRVLPRNRWNLFDGDVLAWFFELGPEVSFLRSLAEVRIGIEIEAATAFGTGHHGTTRGCLMLIDRLAKSGGVARVLDLGTGSGVLAIAAAKSLRCPVLATDIDPIAVRVARENIVANGAAGRAKAHVANGLRDPLIEASAPFDLVTANILADPLIRFAPAIRRITGPDGHLILSGMLDHQAREVLARYLLAGFRLSTRLSLEGWATLLLRRG